MPDLPQWLVKRIERVTSQRFRMQQEHFRQERFEVVQSLRARHVTESEIASLLGVSRQYLSQMAPKGRVS